MSVIYVMFDHHSAEDGQAARKTALEIRRKTGQAVTLHSIHWAWPDVGYSALAAREVNRA